MADQRVAETELAAYKTLAGSLRALHPDFVPEDLGGQWGDPDNWLAHVAGVKDGETRQAIPSPSPRR